MSQHRLHPQDFLPVRGEEYLSGLTPWISTMLSGARSLISAKIGVELLPCLPASRRETLKHLHLDAFVKVPGAVPSIVKTFIDCKQLTSLTITCLNRDWCLPKLDLQHLQLSTCRLQRLCAPSSLLLPLCRVELTLASEQILGWSQLWPQLQSHVSYISIEGFPGLLHRKFNSAGRLRAWPEGIGAFGGLQFLQIDCGEVGANAADDRLDLGHLAYVPHVSLRSQGSVRVSIPPCSWKVLQIETIGQLDVAIADAETFLRRIGTFSFTFPCDKKPHDLIDVLEVAEYEKRVALYRHCSTVSPMHEFPSKQVFVELSNHRRSPKDELSSAFLEALNSHK